MRIVREFLVGTFYGKRPIAWWAVTEQACLAFVFVSAATGHIAAWSLFVFAGLEAALALIGGATLLLRRANDRGRARRAR